MWAPSMPIPSAAAASSTVWVSASAAVGVCEPAACDQWPKLRKPMRLRCATQTLWAMKTLRLLCWARAPETLPRTACLMRERPREPIAIRAASCSSAASTMRLQIGAPSLPAALGAGADLTRRGGAFLGDLEGAFAGRVDQQVERLRLDRDAGGAEEGDPLELLGDDQ